VSPALPGFRSLALTLVCEPGPLLPQIEAELRNHGEPLRWAITEAVCQPGGGRQLTLEAMVHQPALLV
jgi:hypothetical protein